MKPHFLSMVDELLLIKLAEQEALKRWKFPDAAEWKRVGSTVLGYGAGAAIGTALGQIALKKGFGRYIPQMNDKLLTALALGGGALLGFGTAAAMKKGVNRMLTNPKDQMLKEKEPHGKR